MCIQPKPKPAPLVLFFSPSITEVKILQPLQGTECYFKLWSVIIPYMNWSMNWCAVFKWMIHNLSFSLRFFMALIPCWLRVRGWQMKGVHFRGRNEIRARVQWALHMPHCTYFLFCETACILEQVHQLWNQFLHSTYVSIIMFTLYVLCLEHEHLRTATLGFSWYSLLTKVI